MQELLQPGSAMDNHMLFDALMAKASLGIGFLDRELRYIRVNEKLAQINGLPAHDHTGKHIHLIVPSIMPMVRQVISHILSTGQPVENQEFCGETASDPGITRYWSQSWYPLRDDMAEIVGFVILSSENTELKKAEKEILEREEWLVAVNQILHAALTCETERDLGLTCLDAIKRITKSQVGLIGEMKEGLSSIAVSDPGWNACDTLANGHCSNPGKFKINGIYGRVISTKKGLFTNDPESHLDINGLPENHHPLFSFLAVPLMHQGRVFGILAVGNREGGYTQAEQDLLEALSPSVVEAFMRKRANDELEALNHELELRVEKRTRELQETHLQYLHAEKLSAIGKLSASFAHEFNSPLQAVMTVLKILQLGPPMKAEERELLNAAIDESKRMKGLVRSLQDFYRPSSDKKVVVDVHAAIDSVLLLCKIDFSRKRIMTSVNYAKTLPQINAIPDQIKQVFLNLLANAADACLDTGGVILIRTWQEGRSVAVEIEDTGIGIEPSDMEKIFQPFYTTKPVVKGTGLGLSVCHGIVKSHRGRIQVESEPGAGSIFTVYLPINDGYPSPPRAADRALFRPSRGIR